MEGKMNEENKSRLKFHWEQLREQLAHAANCLAPTDPAGSVNPARAYEHLVQAEAHRAELELILKGLEGQ